MKALMRSAHELLKGVDRYGVWAFQGPCVWNEKHAWAPLGNDLAEVSEESAGVHSPRTPRHSRPPRQTSSTLNLRRMFGLIYEL